MKYWGVVTIGLLALAGCGGESKDYESAAMCQNMGLKSGTAEYDSCYDANHKRALMDEQRREYEQMKQNERDWKLRGR